MTDHAVLIAAADLLPAMKPALAAGVRELLTFTDAEALRALEMITSKRPALVMLERRFASTPRGAALISRIKADPSLADTEIRVVTHDASSQAAATGGVPPAAASPGAVAAPRGGTPAQQKPGAQAPVAAPLDYRGTRRAPRQLIAGSMEILVDGSRGTLVDLSMYGAQLVTTTILKPNQRVRVTLADNETTVRCAAAVAWASFEIPKGASPQYRAGLDFIEPDISAIEAYTSRHRQ